MTQRIISADHSGGIERFHGVVGRDEAIKVAEDIRSIISEYESDPRYDATCMQIGNEDFSGQLDFLTCRIQRGGYQMGLFHPFFPPVPPNMLGIGFCSNHTSRATG